MTAPNAPHTRWMIYGANGYSLTIAGSLAVAEYLMSHRPEGGAYTPAKLVGVDLVTGLPGSGGMEVG